VVPLLLVRLVPGQPCEPDDLPPITGRWALVCGGDGRLSEAVDVETGRSTRLDVADVPVAVGAGAVYALGIGGRWTLPSPDLTPYPYVSKEIVGRAATDGEHLALAYADHVEAFTLGDTVRVHIAAHPAPGEPIALAWPEVYWTERSADGDADVWHASGQGAPAVYAGGPGDQRLVAAGDGVVSWVDGGDVRVAQAGTVERFAAASGILSAPAAGAGRACWEDRGTWRATGGTAGTVDVRCSDGSVLPGPPHRLHPAVSGPWLAVRAESGDVSVYAAGPIP